MASLPWIVPPTVIALNAQGWEDLLKEALVTVAQKWSPQLEDYAKANRPWTDRTSQARTGLRGDYEVTEDSVTIYLIHGAAYGIFLELRPPENGGRPIIMPTMEAHYARIFADVDRLGAA